MSVQLSMVGLMVRDMADSLAFYRHLGLAIPDGAEKEKFVMLKMESGVTIFWDTVFAKRYDPAHEPVRDGYQIMLEFFLADEAAVNAKYRELNELGYVGRMEPEQTTGPYAAMVDDPDGNVILLTAG